MTDWDEKLLKLLQESPEITYTEAYKKALRMVQRDKESQEMDDEAVNSIMIIYELLNASSIGSSGAREYIVEVLHNHYLNRRKFDESLPKD